MTSTADFTRSDHNVLFFITKQNPNTNQSFNFCKVQYVVLNLANLINYLLKKNIIKI